MKCGVPWLPSTMAPGSLLGKMGSSVASSTYSLIIGGITYSTAKTGFYQPSTTCTVFLSNFAMQGQAVYQATSSTGGGFISGPIGAMNANGIITNSNSSSPLCTGVTRYQQYGSQGTNPVAQITFPAYGNVVIEANYATIAAPGMTFVAQKITLSPIFPSVAPSTSSPSIKPSPSPTQVPVTLMPIPPGII